MKTFIVQVQHANFEHNGKVVPNFVTLGTVQVTDNCNEEDALRAAKQVFGETHAKELLCVITVS